MTGQPSAMVMVRKERKSLKALASTSPPLLSRSTPSMWYPTKGGGSARAPRRRLQRRPQRRRPNHQRNHLLEYVRGNWWELFIKAWSHSINAWITHTFFVIRATSVMCVFHKFLWGETSVVLRGCMPDHLFTRFQVLNSERIGSHKILHSL